MKTKLLFAFVALANFVFAQNSSDTIKTRNLNEVIINAQKFDVSRLPEIQGTYIFSGKKSEVINLKDINANIAEKTSRQIFAKIPGVFVYDMDGAGNQTNISTRGLDPHRGWEFNIRKNGVILNSDMYGYPASHFSMPFEAIERIELVRGTGSLQYGAQFGGMLNYVTKQPDTTKTFGFETSNSIGSYGLSSTFNAVGGKIGKFEYYAYYSKRVSDGYRKNSKSNYDGQFFTLKYHPTEQITVNAELGRSNYLYQTPGPLNDSMFYADPRQSTRSRNYFSPEIYVPSIGLEWQLSPKTRLSWLTSAVLGQRSSVQFDKASTIMDTINPSTLHYANRQVDLDNFNSLNSELRLLHNYKIGNTSSTLAAGVQVINTDLHRRQLGKGTTGTDYDLTMAGDFGRDLHFKTENIAVFAENKFDISKKWSVNAGMRYENGTTHMTGTISYLDALQVPHTISHQFPLLGLSTNYRLNDNQNFYAGFSQAYRPVVFKDIIPQSVYERADQNLKDAYGYNLEAGYRGNASNFRWDVTVFRLQYNNRLGTIFLTQNNSTLIVRTNIGNSATQGVEAFGEYCFSINEITHLNIFTSTAFFDGRYEDAQVRSTSGVNVSVKGNRIESVPNCISRNGLTLKFPKLGFTALFSYTGETFADALNTVKPSSDGAVGLVPSYTLLDINGSYRFSKNLSFRAGINNIFNNQYFTKRPTFYPGPGVWSSEGRSLTATVLIKI